MPGSGTDRSKPHADVRGPTVILVEPQLGENIGMCARAMGNFGLTELRIVKPRDGWPNAHAQRAAAGADHILDKVVIFETLQEALADCHLVFATTARAHYQAKPVVGPEQAAQEMIAPLGAGNRVAIMFGRERYGLENDEVGLADKIVTFPVNPAFASLNLAQAVLLMGYEWFKHATGNALPFEMQERSVRARREQLLAFFEKLEHELEAVEFFRPPEKRSTMVLNLRNIFLRMEPSQQDIQTLHGVILAIAAGRKGPASGGTLDDAESGKLRALLAEHGLDEVPTEYGPTRGLSKLLRRNPTQPERSLWKALTTDRRFAGRFKRQTPVGRHICDFVSFSLRTVISIAPADESEAAKASRLQRDEWLRERDYRVATVRAQDVESDLTSVLDRLAEATATT
jgi:tRNA/rRNA methyltransferase